MKFRMQHQNFNVSNLETSLGFYEKALGFTEIKRKTGDGFTIVFVGNDTTDFQLELTCLDDHPQKYDLGECEFHLAVRTEEYEKAHLLHEQMGCICFENPKMGIYFIEDPDGYWIEILRENNR
ncbi:MAG: VOC family protein [Oscillospiraceae bacterium]|nr:VOC family protein [Oscillospiraceae bacterium]MBQ2146634.1 VOC family protein [Oscillospiraceae bacterium]